MQEILDAIKAEDVSALTRAYERANHERIQIEGVSVITFTPEAPQFSGSYATTECTDFHLKENVQADMRDEEHIIVIGPSENSGEVCTELSRIVSNKDSFHGAYLAGHMFGKGGEVEGIYVVEEWEVDNTTGKHTSLKECKTIVARLPNDEIDPNKEYERNILTAGVSDTCEIF